MKSINRNSKETDSPKTPGGISKSLLTPIRRLGLSRKWKKSGISPFVSPLADNIVKTDENEQSNSRSRKRKVSVNEDDNNSPLSPVTNTKELDNIEITCTPPAAKANADSTPVRRVTNTRKKSKSFISSPLDPDSPQVCVSTVKQNKSITPNKHVLNDFSINTQTQNIVSESNISNKALRKNILPKKVITEESENKGIEKSIKKEEDNDTLQDNEFCESKNKLNVSNLSKECIVVIQKRILKSVNKDVPSATNSGKKKDTTISQVLFDSDSDDMPLSCINKTSSKQKKNNLETGNENLDDDFIDTKNNNANKIQLPHKATSNSSKKKLASKTVSEKDTMDKKKKNLKENTEKPTGDSSASSQKSKDFDDDDDDDFEINRKTILVRKSYDKVIKLAKSKSTGSITQKDIDDLMVRIEMKKKLLIAKSMTSGTEELRGLIKKWQKGCQDALMELLELMRNKLQDHTNMNYSYILQMLKIPPDLVGYDEENECFNTPDDNSILAAAFNDI